MLEEFDLSQDNKTEKTTEKLIRLLDELTLVLIACGALIFFCLWVEPLLWISAVFVLLYVLLSYQGQFFLSTRSCRLMLLKSSLLILTLTVLQGWHYWLAHDWRQQGYLFVAQVDAFKAAHGRFPEQDEIELLAQAQKKSGYEMYYYTPKQNKRDGRVYPYIYYESPNFFFIYYHYQHESKDWRSEQLY